MWWGERLERSSRTRNRWSSVGSWCRPRVERVPLTTFGRTFVEPDQASSGGVYESSQPTSQQGAPSPPREAKVVDERSKQGSVNTTHLTGGEQLEGEDEDGASEGIAEEKPAGPSTNVCEEQADEDSNEERRRGGQTPPDGGERGHRMCVREGERGESGELAGGRGLGGWRTRTEGRAAEGEQGTAGGTRREEQRQMKVEEEASAGLACLAWLHPARPRASSKWEPDPGGCGGSS